MPKIVSGLDGLDGARKIDPEDCQIGCGKRPIDCGYHVSIGGEDYCLRDYQG